MHDAIAKLSEPELREIIKLRRAVPLGAFLAANGKARQACALRHKGWGEKVLTCSHAVIIACKLNEVRDSLDEATLMSAAESYGLGLIAQEDLTLEEYNLLIECVARVAYPEQILAEQTWTPVPLPSNEAMARQNYEAIKNRDLERSGRKPKTDDLKQAGIDPTKALAAILGKKEKPKEPTIKIDKESVISKMMKALKKSEEIEVGEVIEEPDYVMISPSNREQGKYDVIGKNSSKIYNSEPLPRPADAIVYITRNKLRLK